MKAAVSQVRPYELLVTHLAVKALESSPDLPVQVLPRHVLLLHELDEPVDVPISVCNVLGYHTAVEVYEDLGLGTHHPFSLLYCEELCTVHTTEELLVVTRLLAFIIILQTL